jgi:hypothetical protein
MTARMQIRAYIQYAKPWWNFSVSQVLSSSTGKDHEIIRSVIQTVAVASDIALLIEFGKISDSKTHITGPQLMANPAI